MLAVRSVGALFTAIHHIYRPSRRIQRDLDSLPRRVFFSLSVSYSAIHPMSSIRSAGFAVVGRATFMTNQYLPFSAWICPVDRFLLSVRRAVCMHSLYDGHLYGAIWRRNLHLGVCLSYDADRDVSSTGLVYCQSWTSPLERPLTRRIYTLVHKRK